jgi:4-diphosphocytidyl-2-C-methyl-D-erythritol kinase
MSALEKLSPCKVNLLLNILGKRSDGFHELETVMQPVNLLDRITFEKNATGVHLTCSEAALPTDSRNLVFCAASAFLDTAKIKDGVRLHLEKKIPLAAGLGGGSGNAATTLLGLNELFGSPLSATQLHQIAASLGSDIPFFLQSRPALASGRGELIEPLEPFPALQGTALILIHPGFGVATAWAYQQLAHFPMALNGQAGRAKKLIELLRTSDAKSAGKEFYNSLEAPALKKYPLLVLFQEFLREQGAAATLMSGSGSTTFAVVKDQSAAEKLAEQFKGKFGANNWVTVVPV